MAAGRKTGGGSRKGIPNKITGDLKAMILGALDDAGGRDYLRQQALDNPGPFLALIGKVLPTQVTGPGDGPVQVSVEARLSEAKAILDAAFGKEGDGEA